MRMATKAAPSFDSRPKTAEGNGATPAARDHARRKARGIHYTPPLLASYLARQVVLSLTGRKETCGEIAVLDPACGDGALLKAIVETAPRDWRERILLTGFDTDDRALARAEKTLAGVGALSVSLHCSDFLSVVPPADAVAQLSLVLAPEQHGNSRLGACFDAVICNPPYVRTQVLGSAAARELASRFELSGRVDLYHAFVKAMTRALADGGILGLLTSNRFLTVQSGGSMREWLLEHFHLLRLVDLGDTKLFAAAVLPAILVARRSAAAESQDCEFIRVYEVGTKAGAPAREADSVLEVLDGSFAGRARVNGVCFQVETGRLEAGTDSRTPWSITNGGVASWLATVRGHSSGTFSDVAKVCVGIKTTADSVFVRDNWEDLPPAERPEGELLHPLVTHHLAVRWRLPTGANGGKRVLYPYESDAEGRVPVNLGDYPRAGKYLLKHQERLQGRSYVIASGRKWYEVWVPHRPLDWTLPKLAFPDISETSKFFLVERGWIVNGDCYWIKLLPGKEAKWLMLMLAVANSSFVLRFYDVVFHNKLYSGRRRFMSQYVSRFPLPKMSRAGEILELMPRLLDACSTRNSSELERLEAEMNRLVWKAFGLREEVPG
jgi:methylase of polypeptide subunit release factors